MEQNINNPKIGIHGLPDEETRSPFSPLTGLHGSASAERQIKRYLHNNVNFALCCLDMDNFHAYNACYSYEKGDEVLRYTADIIQTTAEKMTGGNYFAAHLGGDDFIFITTWDKCEALSQAIANAFDKGISAYYSEEAKSSGFITISDRRNRKIFFPILSVTISIITPEPTRHYGEIMQSVVELRKYGKKIAPRNGGSIYVRDRRL